MLLKLDVLVVINVIKHYKIDDAGFCLIITNCILLLKKIPNCLVSFVKRLTNQMAHILSRAISGLGV